MIGKPRKERRPQNERNASDLNWRFSKFGRERSKRAISHLAQ